MGVWVFGCFDALVGYKGCAVGASRLGSGELSTVALAMRQLEDAGLWRSLLRLEPLIRHTKHAPSPCPTVSQSGFSCLRMHTASSVICTSGGGLGNDLISTMSFWGAIGCFAVKSKPA